MELHRTSKSKAPTAVTSDAYIAKTITMTEALKTQFPHMIIFGPVHYGFQGIYNWQGELNTTPNGQQLVPRQISHRASAPPRPPSASPSSTFTISTGTPKNTIRAARAASTSPATTLTAAQVQLIVQSPRNLWDPTFNDTPTNSNPWIYEELGNTPINLLGRLQSKINSEFPGMKISMTEYESGGWNHIAGTIAQADNLGIFGAQGVFAANFWPPNGTYSYALAGFRAFRDFDAAGANFGDTSLQSTSSNVANVVGLRQQRHHHSRPNRFRRHQSLPVVASHRHHRPSANRHRPPLPNHRRLRPKPNSVAPVSIGTMPVNGSTLTLTLPALSVTTIDVQLGLPSLIIAALAVILPALTQKEAPRRISSTNPPPSSHPPLQLLPRRRVHQGTLA